MALGQAYDERCDVYSTALIIWEMLTLEKPFAKTTIAKMKQSVWDEAMQYRPEIVLADQEIDEQQQVINFLSKPKSGWTKSLKTLIEKSWSHNFDIRPKMEEFESNLSTEVTTCLSALHKLHGCLACEFLSSRRLSHDNRRSTFVYEGADGNQVTSKGRRSGDRLKCEHCGRPKISKPKSEHSLRNI